MRVLLSSTCVIAIAAAAPAAAEKVISTATTTPVQTATENDDIRISSTGSIKPASGTAVTINSNHDVKNEGTIQIIGASNSAGIVANPGFAGNITNTGTITVDENYTPTDGDSDGDLDGAFAQGSGRFGIRVLPGGTFTGTIANSGTIKIEGNQSAGIAVDGMLAGSLVNSGGSISVLGTNSVGIRAGDISGNVTLSGGNITAQGENAVGVSLTGDIGGALVIQNSISATGYRSTTPPGDTSKLDADDLLQGGSAVVVAGNVAGGILFDARPADNSTTDTDEDDDGIPDANESTAAINGYGAAPAVLIGSSEDIAIGAVATSANGHGLVIKGAISGNGLYNAVSSTGLQIGGAGGAVDLGGGMTVGGTVTAKSANADATAIRVGAGAIVPEIAVSGSIGAQGGGTATTRATALLIESGADVSTLTNSGSILAARSGTSGTAAGIVDQSGMLTLIENKGQLGVVGATALGDSGIAFDLSANSTGVTVRQLAVAATVTAPAISGNLLFGSGNDLLDVADGTVLGSAYFGAGDDSLALSGDSVMTGDVEFGAGTGTLSLAGTSVLNGIADFAGGSGTLALSGTSVLRGNLAGSGGVDVTVGGGSTLDVTSTGTVDLASLTTGAGATLGVSLNAGTGAVTLYNVAGAANFGADTKINVNLLSVGGVTGTYTIVDAGTLTGLENLSSAIADLPFLYTSSVAAGDPGEVRLSVGVKSAEQLGLNASEANILAAAMEAADADSAIAATFLGAGDSAEVRTTLQQLLPEHSGGGFESASKGSRLAAGLLADPRMAMSDQGGLGMWMQQIAWGTSKSIGTTSSYDVNGWGAVGGIEHSLGGAGNVGVSLAFLSGKDGRFDNELISSQYEGGIYWRGGFGPFHAFARGTAGVIDFDGTRVFSGSVGGEDFRREAEGSWKGRIYSATGGVSYEARMGRLSIRPLASIEHFRLSEDGYAETGGGDAFNLVVEDRDSSETAANGLLTIGYQLSGGAPNQPWMRLELEGGRREVLSGSLGATRAAFAGGETFELAAEERTSGFRGALRLLGGGPAVAISGEVGAEEQQGEMSLGGRIGVQFGL